MNVSNALKRLMKEKGFALIRRGKHDIWRDTSGIQIVTSTTPSDFRTMKNIEASIKKARLKTNSKR